ncbi:MAG: hypothetical protein ACLQSR_12595 [Limisphaerales bacterium]
MKHRNNIAGLLAAGLLAFGPALPAQNSTNAPPAGSKPPGAPGVIIRTPNADRMLRMLSTRLNLTPDEQTKVKPILDNQTTQTTALLQDRSLSMPDRRAKLLSIRQDTIDKMKGVLTPDQFTQYQIIAPRGPLRVPPVRGTNAPAATPPSGAPPAATPPPQQ